MIKVALKHFIYEKCISLLFNYLNNNFSRVHELNVGDTFAYIGIGNGGGVSFLYNVRIVEATYYGNLRRVTFRPCFDLEHFTVEEYSTDDPYYDSSLCNKKYFRGKELYYNHSTMKEVDLPETLITEYSRQGTRGYRTE